MNRLNKYIIFELFNNTRNSYRNIIPSVSQRFRAIQIVGNDRILRIHSVQ